MNCFNKIKNNRRIHLLLILLLICVNMFAIKIYATTNLTKRNSITDSSKISIEYFEDIKDNLTFDQIKSKEFSNNFKNQEGSTISIGYSRSNWWFRIKVKGLYDLNANRYFSVNNANIEKITLYLPRMICGQETYYDMKAGWGFKNEVDDVGFIYPVFRILDEMSFDRYIYIHIKSPYTQNYEFKIVSNEEFDELRQLSLLCIGGLFGILIAMLLYNFILFIFLKDMVYLYYVSYMFIMIIYQAGLTGVIRIFKWKSAYLVEQYFGMSGFFMIISAIVFIRTFLKTDKNVPLHDKFLKMSLCLLVCDIFIMLIGHRYVSLVTSAFVANAVVFLILSTAISCLYKKVRQARYFLIAWSVMIIGAMFFMLRGFGVISQNLITMNCVLAGAAFESILISVALADRINLLREEKENAEKRSKLHEIAFLKAQIKPHFLFNALNVIAALCCIEPEKARELIIDLSNYLRHTFDVNNKSEYITFKEEIEFTESYVSIQKARFRDKLKVEYDIEDTSELILPPLILQPLVENAIRHGIRKKEQGVTVIVRVENKKDCFIIEIEDNGIGMSKEELENVQNANFEKGNGIGLVNIKLRLKEMYGTDLKIESEIGIGTLVSFKIPKI